MSSHFYVKKNEAIKRYYWDDFLKQYYSTKLYSAELRSVELRSVELRSNSNLHSRNTFSSQKRMVKNGVMEMKVWV